MPGLPEALTAITTFEEAAAVLRARGISLAAAPGEYIVNFRKGSAATEYRTDDLTDAVAYGLSMGEAPQETPPLGPMGRSGSRRGRIYAHNRKLAARRAKGKKE